MTSSQILMILILWMTSEVLAEDLVCYQCASPNLQNNWGLTGLPLKPDSLKFDSVCAKADTNELVPDFISGNCASSCFELMLPVNGEYGFVRGCHENFVSNEFKVTNGTCHVNLVSTLYAGVSFCPPANAEADKCNSKISTSSVQAGKGVTGCETEAKHSCKSCTEYGGSGSCSASTTDTCKGVYCTKTTGRLNGQFYESRGCGYFNPIGSNVCSWTDQVYNVSTGIDSAMRSRKKRAVSLAFQANQFDISFVNSKKFVSQ
uniref:Secreted protein n=1 Tax=Caenorhabditis tropicalis TaxID=1561998 RepID=A0A1I7UUN9_9PELO